MSDNYGDFYAPNTIDLQSRRLAAKRATRDKWIGGLAVVLILGLIGTVLVWNAGVKQREKDQAYQLCLYMAQSSVDAMRCDLAYDR